MTRNHVVKRRVLHHRVRRCLLVTDDVIDVDDLVEAVAHPQVGFVLLLQLCRARMVEIADRPFALANSGRRQRSDLQPAHGCDVDAGELRRISPDRGSHRAPMSGNTSACTTQETAPAAGDVVDYSGAVATAPCATGTFPPPGNWGRFSMIESIIP